MSRPSGANTASCAIASPVTISPENVMLWKISACDSCLSFYSCFSFAPCAQFIGLVIQILPGKKIPESCEINLEY